MLRNYLKIAVRNLWRNNAYTALNIGGLALGIATLLTITLFVSHELSYDRFHKNADRIFGTIGKFSFGDMRLTGNRLSAAYAPFLEDNFEEVEKVVRIGEYPAKDVSFKSNNGKHKENNVALSENALFEIFTFDVLEGNATTSLTKPMTVAISESMAQKYFGSESALGKAIEIDDKFLAEVSCVYSDLPENSSLQYDFILSLSSLPQLEKFYWGEETSSLENTKIQMGSFQTYALVSNPSSIQSLQKKLPAALISAGAESEQIKPDSYTFYSLTDLHLADLGLSDGKLREYVVIFSIIGLIVIALALINYINLTTSLSFQRAKEVGVRKAIGANKRQISKQFFVESVLVTSVSFFIGTLLFYLFKDNFYDLLGIEFTPSFLISPFFISSLAAVYLVCVFATSIYPSVFLSKFSPIKVLKSNFNVKVGGVNLRKGLIVGQFALSIALLISTIVIYQQFKFMLNFDVGLQKDNTLVVPLEAKYESKSVALQSEIQRSGTFKKVGVSNFNFYKTYGGRYFTKSPVNDEEVTLATMRINHTFFEMMGLEWLQKPTGDLNLANEKTAIINQTAQKAYGFEEDNFRGQKIGVGTLDMEVNGVFKDFHFIGPQASVEPVMISFFPEGMVTTHNEDKYFYIKLNEVESTQNQVAAIKGIFNKILPGEDFNFHFLDDAYQAQYDAEKRLITFVSFFSALAIIISCLGLFGLAKLSIEQKTKEIGVRKVLGASLLDLSKMLTVDFIQLIVVAGIIAVPIAYYVTGAWLKDFSSRIDLAWLYFALPCAVAILLSVLTVGLQSIKAGLTNPVKSLRSE